MMNLPEENTKTGPTGKKSSIAAFILLFLAIMTVSFYVYLKSIGTDLAHMDLKVLAGTVFQPKGEESAKKQTFEIGYDVKDHAVFCTYRGFLVKCTSDSIKYLDSKGEEKFSFPVSLANPAVKTAGSFLLVADIGGKSIYVMNGSGKKWDAKLDNNIINADISESGHVSIVSESRECNGRITIYDPRGNVIFTKENGENFVLSAVVSPGGDRIVINSMDASGIRANANLEFTDILGTPRAGKISGDNTVFPSVRYLGNNYVMAVSDSSLTCFDINGEEKWREDMNGMICSSGVLMGRFAAVAVNTSEGAGGRSGSCDEIRIYNVKGQQVETYRPDESIKSIDTYEDIIAVNTGRTVYFVNTGGRLNGQLSLKSDIKQVCFFNRQEVGVVTKDRVVIAKIG